MRLYFIIFCLLATSDFSLCQKLDFKFYSTGGKYEYGSLTFLNQLEAKYSYRYEGMKLILVETPSLSDSLFLQQCMVLEKLNAEELQLLFVYSCWNEIDSSGYYTTIETAQQLSDGYNEFRIRFLDSEANVIYSGNHILSELEIMDILSN